MTKMIEILKDMQAEYESMVDEQSRDWEGSHTPTEEDELLDYDHFLNGYGAAITVLEQKIRAAGMSV